MKLYYFIHLTGRDPGNSGIQRVVRNLGTALNDRPDIELVPVRWCAEQRAVVHAEEPFIKGIQLFAGPIFVAGEDAGEPIHLDAPTGDDAATDGADRSRWLLMPEAPHLGSHDPDYPPVHLSYPLGYLRRHGIRTAAILHDIIPLSHLGREDESDPGTLKFIIYANALALADIIIPVSSASAVALQNWFARTGIAVQSAPAIRAVLLPEEIVGIERDSFIETGANGGAAELAMWGSIHPHKNQTRVLDAFNLLCDRRPDLDLRLHVFGLVMGELAPTVGRAARRSGGRIKLHGFVDDHVMLEVVGRCRATIFLSLAEGYGLPLAESLWLGKPCITSNLAPMTEIAAAGGCFVTDPTEREEIVAAIEAVATNDALLAVLKQELAARPMSTWSDYAGRIVALIEGVPEARQEPTFEQAKARRAPIVATSRDIHPSDLSYLDSYREGVFSILRDGLIHYDREIHTFASDHILFYGPYWDLPKGRYKLRIVARLEGRIGIKMTFDHGGTEIGQWFPTNSVDVLDFELEKSVSGFEILASRLPDTRRFDLSQMTLERLV